MSYSLNILESKNERQPLVYNEELIKISDDITSNDEDEIFKLLDASMNLAGENNKTIFKILSNIIRSVCVAENWDLLDEVFNHKLLKLHKKEELLYILIKNYKESERFLKCFDKLLSSENVDINNVEGFGYPLIDHALSEGADLLVKKFLKAGAYIGHYSRHMKSFTVEEIHPELLKEFFDECVTSNHNNASNQSYEINFNYKNFIPPNSETNEMDPLMSIVSTKKLLHLLKHPLITSFLLLKWQRIAMFFYINYLLFCCFGLSMVGYIFLSYIQIPPIFIQFSYWQCVLGIAYIIVRELIQLRKPKKYFLTFSNYLEILIVCFCITTITIDIKSATGKPIAAFTIVLLAAELCILVGSLPVLSISTHMLMLEEVMKSFLKSFALYFIFILMFVLCFFVLLGEEVSGNSKPKPEIEQGDNAVDGEADEHTKMFSNIFDSFVKVMAMFVGELDLENLGLKTSYSYIFFLLFIICITIVLMNLLNGLAVSDIQVIREQAGLNEMICRAKVLHTYDCNLFPLVNKNQIENKEQCICWTSVRVWPNYKHPNFVLDPTKNRCLFCSNENEVNRSKPQNDDYDIITLKNIQALVRSEAFRLFTDCFMRRSTVMDSHTIKASTDVLAKKDLAKKEAKQLEETKRNSENQEIQLQNIEENMHKMFELMKNFQIRQI